MRTLKLLTLAGLIAVASCGSDSNSNTSPSPPAPPPSTNAVGVANFAFSPSGIQVTPGTTVTWTWASNAVEHNVTFSDGATSGNRGANATFTRTFAAGGTFSYHCTIHPQMTGTVTVQ